MRKRGSFLTDNLGEMVLVGLIVLIVVGGYILLSGRGSGMIEYLKNLFRFGG